MVVKKGWFFAGDPDAVLDEKGPLRVVKKSRRELPTGQIEFRFEVVPSEIGRDIDAAVLYGRTRSSEEKFKVNIDMPSFSGRSNGSFAEMANAPDTSVYGSHITFWRNADSRYVSGHAASNVCRRISAAVIDYAMSRANGRELLHRGRLCKPS